MRNYLFLVLIVLFATSIVSAQKKKENNKKNNQIQVEDFDEMLKKIEGNTWNENKKSVLVLDFTNESFFESTRVGPAVSKMFETVCLKSGSMNVQDRRRINTIDNQQLSFDQLLEQSKSIGLNYLIDGTITEFGVKKTGTSFKVKASAQDNSSSGSTNPSVGVGMDLEVGEGTSRVVIDIKFIDVNTGTIIYQESAEGESSSGEAVFGTELLTSTDPSGSDNLSVGFNVGRGVQGFDETLTGKAMRNACISFMYKLMFQNSHILK